MVEHSQKTSGNLQECVCVCVGEKTGLTSTDELREELACQAVCVCVSTSVKQLKLEQVPSYRLTAASEWNSQLDLLKMPNLYSCGVSTSCFVPDQ